MWKKTPHIIFIFLVSLQYGISQSKSYYGIELGITFSQFQTENVYNESWETKTSRTRSHISPVVGITKDWIILKHLQIETGLLYQTTGKRTYSYTDYTATDYYAEEWESLKMHKLCIPSTLGYIFMSGKINFSIYTGFRPNIILSGKMTYKYHSIIMYADRIDNIDFENDENLMDKTEYYIPPKRVYNQFIIGLSTTLNDHFWVNLNFNLGHNLYKRIYVSRGNYSTYTWTEETNIPGNDYILCMQYRF